ncbi:MAG: acyl carrier protein [Clostridia bacterium]|nr:acyl carrier protein [Clostridia bacterium]MBQ1995961.1 acyl carrier protein [Clostridia bacterium]MBQ5905944.1 acyl carrier protein [Clostridia bacterium]
MIEKLTEIIREHKGGEEVVLTEDTVIIADLGLNSLDLINLVTDIEDEFDVEIPDRAIKMFKTVGDVIRFIESEEDDD